MDQNQQTEPTLTAYDIAVEKAYFQTLDFVKQMLATHPSYEVRCSLEADTVYMIPCYRHWDFVSPRICLSLWVDYPRRYIIHFGYQQVDEEDEFADFSSKFLRALYKFTSVPFTEVDIEDCVVANNLITSCEELFDAIGESDYKSHVFKEIAYQARLTERKVQPDIA